jgi:hypothetical protein
VTAISIKGEALTATYGSSTPAVVKQSKKEVGVGLTETLKNYSVTPEELAAVKITVENQGGFGFWLVTLAPFLMPIVFLAFFI